MSIYAWLFLSYLPPYSGVARQVLDVSFWTITQAVLIYLGIPFLLGFLTRLFLVKAKGLLWYQSQFIAKISPLKSTRLAIHYCGDVVSLSLDVLHIAIPLTIYFVLMFFISFS